MCCCICTGIAGLTLSFYIKDEGLGNEADFSGSDLLKTAAALLSDCPVWNSPLALELRCRAPFQQLLVPGAFCMQRLAPLLSSLELISNTYTISETAFGVNTPEMPKPVCACRVPVCHQVA